MRLSYLTVLSSPRLKVYPAEDNTYLVDIIVKSRLMPGFIELFLDLKKTYRNKLDICCKIRLYLDVIAKLFTSLPTSFSVLGAYIKQEPIHKLST